MKIIVVIPTYNEAENIRILIPNILGLGPAYNVLIVDDNSPDGTAGVAEGFIRDGMRVSILKRPSKLGLGMLYIRMDRPHDALGQLQRAVELKPDFANGLNALGVAYAETGDLHRAEMSFRSALAHDPDSADATRNLQRVLDAKKGNGAE